MPRAQGCAGAAELKKPMDGLLQQPAGGVSCWAAILEEPYAFRPHSPQDQVSRPDRMKHYTRFPPNKA